MHSKAILEQSPIPLILLDHHKIEQVNFAFLSAFGYSTPGEISGKTMKDFLAPGSFKLFQKLTKDRLNTGSLEENFEALRSDGSTFDVRIRLSPISLDEQVFNQAAIIDLGEQKKTLRNLSIVRKLAEAVSNSRELDKLIHSSLATLMETMEQEIAAFYLADKKKGTLELNYSRNLPEVISQKLSSLNMEDGIGGLLAKTLEPQHFLIKKYPSYLPNKSIFKQAGCTGIFLVPIIFQEECVGVVFLATASEVNPEAPTADSLSIVSHELGRAVASLSAYGQVKESETRYKTMIESISDTVYHAEPNGAFTYISPNVEKLTGYPPREFYRNRALLLSLVFRDDKKILLERNSNIDSLGERAIFEYRLVPKGKASHRWVRDIITVHRSEEGVAEGFSGILSDITTYKNLAEELVQSNELNASILSSVNEGVVVYSKSLKCIHWNDAMEAITGLTKSDVIGKHVSEIFRGDDAVQLAHLLDKALKGSAISSDEFRYMPKNSRQEVYIWGRYTPLRDLSNEITGVVGVMADITKNKVLERDLRESEQVLRNVLDTMGDILVITDLKGDVLQVNRAFFTALGYSRAEVMKREFPYPWLLEEEMGRYVLWISTLREKTWLHDFDMTWKTKDGRSISMSLSTTLLRNSLGDPIAMLNIARDISDRKRLVRELEERNRQVELLNRIIGAGNKSMDFDEIFSIIANEIGAVVSFDDINVALIQKDGNSMQMYAAFGISTAMKGQTFSLARSGYSEAVERREPIIVNDFEQEDFDSMFSARSGIRSQLTLPLYMKERPLGTLSFASLKPDNYRREHIEILRPIAQQVGAIIDRVRLFKQVSEDASYIHNLLDSIDSVVYTVDTEYKIIEVNKAWYEFIQDTGAKVLDDYHGVDIFEALPHDSLKVLFLNIGSDVLTGGVRFFSQEFQFDAPYGKRIFQVTMNPMVMDKKVTGLVITHSDITALKETEVALKRNNEQLITVNEISALITTSRNLDEILAMAIPLLQKTLEADAVIVYLVDSTGTRLDLAYESGFTASSKPLLNNLVIKGSATGVVVVTKEPIFLAENVLNSPEIYEGNRQLFRDEHVQALSILPLMAKDSVMGAVDIFYRQPHEFSVRERQLLTLIGNQIGTAIENAQLYGELRAQIDRLTVLYEFSEQLTSKLDVDQIYTVVSEHTSRLLPFNKLVITLYSAESDSLKLVYQVQKKNDPTLEPPLPVNKADDPVWKVVRSKKSYQDSSRRVMYVPMISKETIIGVITVIADPELNYTSTHLRLLESLGNLAGIALEKAELHEETVQKSAEIERRNKELDDFTYVVSHDLKEPLISIEGFSNILQMDYKDILKGEGKEYLDSIEGASVRMKALIDDLLVLSRISRPSESFKPVRVSNVIQEVKAEMEYTIRQKNVEFIVPVDLPTVFGNETQIKIVFRNLIGNSLKFNDKPRQIVEIGFRDDQNGRFLFWVRDNGIGIEKEFHQKIFVIFQRLHRREDYEGTGAGLAIVKKIIEVYNGTVWVESEPHKGSTFYFTLPQLPVHT